MRAHRAREEARLRAKAAKLGIDIAALEAQDNDKTMQTRLWLAIKDKEAEQLN